MKQETWNAIVKEVGQSHQVTIVLKLKIKKDLTITCESDISTGLIKRLVPPQREENKIKYYGRKRRWQELSYIPSSVYTMKSLISGRKRLGQFPDKRSSLNT